MPQLGPVATLALPAIAFDAPPRPDGERVRVAVFDEHVAIDDGDDTVLLAAPEFDWFLEKAPAIRKLLD